MIVPETRVPMGELVMISSTITPAHACQATVAGTVTSKPEMNVLLGHVRMEAHATADFIVPTLFATVLLASWATAVNCQFIQCPLHFLLNQSPGLLYPWGWGWWLCSYCSA